MYRVPVSECATRTLRYTVYSQRGVAPHAEPSFRLGRFYFPRALPRPWAGFEIKRQPESDCLSLHDHDSACRFLFFVHVHLGCIAFNRTVFFRVSFRGLMWGLYTVIHTLMLRLLCMPRSRCVDDGPSQLSMPTSSACQWRTHRGHGVGRKLRLPWARPLPTYLGVRGLCSPLHCHHIRIKYDMMSHDIHLCNTTQRIMTQKKKTNDGSRDPTTFSPGDLVPTPGRQQTADGRLYIFFFPFENECRKSEIGEQTFKSWPWPWVGAGNAKGPGERVVSGLPKQIEMRT